MWINFFFFSLDTKPIIITWNFFVFFVLVVVIVARPNTKKYNTLWNLLTRSLKNHQMKKRNESELYYGLQIIPFLYFLTCIQRLPRYLASKINLFIRFKSIFFLITWKTGSLALIEGSLQLGFRRSIRWVCICGNPTKRPFFEAVIDLKQIIS